MKTTINSGTTKRTFYSNEAFNRAVKRDVRILELKAALEDNPRRKAALLEEAARRTRFLQTCNRLLSNKRRLYFETADLSLRD